MNILGGINMKVKAEKIDKIKLLQAVTTIVTGLFMLSTVLKHKRK